MSKLKTDRLATTESFDVSTIVPFYNAAEYIVDCARSLFEQTLQNIQFIFVDDGSTDESVDMLRELILHYPDLKHSIAIVQHPVNKGVATARNTGMQIAEGKYIGWVDADDSVDLAMFENLFNKAKETSAEIVFSDFYNVYTDRIDHISQNCGLTSISCIKALMIGDLMGGMCNKIVLRGLYIDNSIRYPDGLNMCEDLRVCVQLFYYAKKIGYINKPFYYYSKFRDHSISVSSTLTPVVNTGWVENVRAIVQFVEDKKLPNMSDEIGLIKLAPKRNLLIKGNSLASFKQWRIIFPEANSFVWRTNLPFYYKFIAWCADKKLWQIVSIWIIVKRTFGNWLKCLM